MLAIEQVKELAMKLYNKGGDTIIECYTDRDIQNLINFGIDAEEKLIKFIQQVHEVDEEYRLAAMWGAYGTTDEEEIERVNREDEDAELLVSEEECDDSSDDPCYGCQRCSGYNCKHCQYGDDGNYSVYDVYSPSELGVTVKW